MSVINGKVTYRITNCGYSRRGTPCMYSLITYLLHSTF